MEDEIGDGWIEIEGERYSYENLNAIANDRERKEPCLIRPSVLQFLDQIGTIPPRRDHLGWIVTAISQKFLFPSKNGHAAFWNDGLYAAERFNLRDHDKKRGAIVALWNGRHKYWEWETHYGFDMARLFSDMGLITPEKAEEFKEKHRTAEGCYVGLPKKLHDKLREKFSLTREDLMSARWLCENVWQKETTNNHASGQYNSLITLYNID